MAPPFLPTGRNEDGLFGLTLSAVDRMAVVGHLPYAVPHDSTRSSRYGRYAFVSASQTRVADLMIHLVSSWIPSTSTSAPKQRLGRLIDWLAELASLDEAEFAKVIVETIFKVRERELTFIDAALRAESGYPDYWQRDLRRYRNTLLKNLRKPSFFVPVELTRSRPVRGGWSAIRQFIRMSSDCLAAWPTLWAEARRTTRVV